MAKNASNPSASVGGLIVGIVMLVVGLPLLNPVLLIMGIVLIVQNRGAVARKKEEPAPSRSAPPRPPQTYPMRPAQPAPRQSVGVSYQSYAQDHYHITNVGLSVEKRLEQLEVMKNAGLIDKEEYQQKLQDILRDK